MRSIVGNVPEPDELYGREEFLEYLWKQIGGNNILLLAPRRFGKTGVMRHVLCRPQEGYLPIYLNLEDVDSPEEFLWRLTGELLSHAPLRQTLLAVRRLPSVIQTWVKEQFEEAEFQGARLKFKADAAAIGWRDPARKLLVELEQAAPTLILIFDELPAMLEGIERKQDMDAVKDFMAWFRTVRLQQADKLRRHRFVVGGSIGIDMILRKAESPDKLNDFERLYVEPIPHPDALRLAKDLAQSLDVGFPDGGIERLLALIGPHVPYFIQILFSQLAQLPRDRRRPLKDKTLVEVYEGRVLGPACKHYFDHFRSRLTRYGKPLEKAAMAVLKEVASKGRVGASALYDVYAKARKRGAREQEFCELVADLECEWYLVLDPRTNEYYFMVDVMRDWWRRWYASPRPRGPAEAKG